MECILWFLDCCLVLGNYFGNSLIDSIDVSYPCSILGMLKISVFPVSYSSSVLSQCMWFIVALKYPCCRYLGV